MELPDFGIKLVHVILGKHPCNSKIWTLKSLLSNRFFHIKSSLNKLDTLKIILQQKVLKTYNQYITKSPYFDGFLSQHENCAPEQGCQHFFSRRDFYVLNFFHSVNKEVLGRLYFNIYQQHKKVMLKSKCCMVHGASRPRMSYACIFVLLMNKSNPG